MRKIFLSGLVIAFCLSSVTFKSLAQGWVNVKKNDKFLSPIARNMATIPAGQTYVGVPVDIMDTVSTAGRMVSISGFFMDRTEVSNKQYREFVNWVRDSVATTMLGPTAAPNLYKPVATTKGGATLTSQRAIDWNNVKKYLWHDGNGGYASKLEAMYYSGDDALLGRREIDIRKLKYSFSILNMDLAAAGRNNPSMNRKDFIQSYVDDPDPAKANEFPSIAVYPDTLVWMVDYGYSQNKPMAKDYFSNPAYDDYPVVGVTWEQANAYCIWLTKKYEGAKVSKKHPKLEFRLPTAAEFEYAAKAGHEQSKFPWTGELITDDKERLQANFKNDPGNYTPDNGLYPVHVRSYLPNDYELYNLAGNVAEWTATAYNPSAAALLHDVNPNYTFVAKATDSKYLKRKVVKGGSWKDIAYFLQNSVATYEYQDQPRSYIGFRCVASYPGSNIK
ncbi:gliding motility-associated lipoprotein GldK [Pedobacter sp. CAN_A7]|uniref:type IX secretion system lipoprotein PorK/GldK n=1 Tax=Pedobacter sp. CAN_A7 TaxID=2787722 RepID=UPI0018CBD782